MKKRALLLSMAFLAVTARAQEGKLGVTLDLTYMSKWLSKGVEAYGDKGALFKTVDLDFYGTGFGVKVTHRNATSSGYVDNERLDYGPYYKGELFEDTSYAMSYNLSARYEHYYRVARNVANTTWEWIFAFSWPNLMPHGFTPGYIAHYEYPAGSGYVHRDVAGWVHRFMLGYDLPVWDLATSIRLSSEVAYTDGLGGAAHDWSYATFGASTKFPISDNLFFLPGVYHQISMEDTVAKDDVTYCILSMRYEF